MQNQQDQTTQKTHLDTANEALVEVQFILSTTHSDGRSADDVLDELEDKLIDENLMMIQEVADTAYLTSKEGLVTEEAIRITVIVPDTAVAVLKVKKLVVDTATKLKQPCLYFKVMDKKELTIIQI